MAKESQVSVAGALRMDSLLTTINKKFSTKNTRRKKVTLFYFDYRDSLFGKEKLPCDHPNLSLVEGDIRSMDINSMDGSTKWLRHLLQNG